MAKSSGLGMRLYLDGYAISNDIQSIGRLGGGPAVLEFTGIDKEAFERKGGRLDGGIDVTGYFNPAAGRAHEVFSALPLTDRIATVTHIASGETWNAVAKQGNYDPTVAADGMLTVAVAVQPNGFGVECGKLLTPLGSASQSGAGSLASVDFGTDTKDFGLQAHLHVLAFTGTSATITIEESSDDGAVDTFAAVTGGAFTTVTGVGAERIQTARDLTIERYLRVTTTGTFSELEFVVSVEPNLTEVVF